MANVVYGNIKVVSPFEILYLCQLKIHKCLNQHTRVSFTGVIHPDKKDSYVNSVSVSDTIQVSKVDSSEDILFKGIVSNIEINAVRGIHYLKVEAVSATYNLDIKFKRRSFQHKDMTYKDLIKEVIKDHSGTDFIDTVSKGKVLEKFIIQYDETDWEFLKRMASHFNTALVPDSNNDKAKFWFGIPQGSSKGKLEEFHYRVSKTIGIYRESSENYIGDIEEKDFTYYEIETDKLLCIGDKVQYNNISLVVYKITSEIISGILKHLCVLTPEKGLSQNIIRNKKVFKVSVEGKVIETKEDNIRIHLEIDDKQKKDEAYWFPYSTFFTTEGSTGWYCMPEIDDYVKLYFPSNKEEEAIVINSIRRRINKGDKIDDPDVKYFRTKFKKEKKYNKEELLLSAKDDKVLIKLHQDKGIEIYSDSEIKIKSDNNMEIDAENIEMKAADEISMKCKASSIKMDGTTHIKGTFVRERC
ncbi:UNVERIFIED_CONTAM: hypothetical protein Cloal_3553 [Acetivibrio alkalicellulosi]